MNLYLFTLVMDDLTKSLQEDISCILVYVICK